MEDGRIEALKGLLAKNPDDAMLYYLLGNEYFKTGRFGEAIEEALRGIVSYLTPLKPTLRNELIQLLGTHVDRARTAKESLEKLLADLE